MYFYCRRCDLTSKRHDPTDLDCYRCRHCKTPLEPLSLAESKALAAMEAAADRRFLTRCLNR